MIRIWSEPDSQIRVRPVVALRYYVLVNWAFKLKLGAFILGVRLLRVQRTRVQGWGSSAGSLERSGAEIMARAAYKLHDVKP